MLFGNLGVNLRVSLCGVPKYASAQTLGFLDLARKPLVCTSGTAQFPLGFPDGNWLELDDVIHLESIHRFGVFKI
jgi:hypothetical protein